MVTTLAAEDGVMCRPVRSLCGTPEINTTLYINQTSVKKKKKSRPASSASCLSLGSLFSIYEKSGLSSTHMFQGERTVLNNHSHSQRASGDCNPHSCGSGKYCSVSSPGLKPESLLGTLMQTITFQSQVQASGLQGCCKGEKLDRLSSRRKTNL